MLGPGRPDDSIPRARLRALAPRWVPTEADLASVDPSPRGRDEDGPGVPADESDRPQPVDPQPDAGRHSLPARPGPSWRLDRAAARSLISLTLAAVIGALAVVVWGWPRGESAGGADSSAPSARVDNVLIEPTPDPSGSSALVLVDVDGEVRRPGVVELEPGSRVTDAIKAAGGVTRAGDTGALNLAEVLIDGQQVVVPPVGSAAPVDPDAVTGLAPGGAASAPTSSVSVSLNSATAVELETLPGIGPVLAAAIVEWRTQNGGFTSIEQLQEVSGIGPATFAELAPLVRL